jgi:hypothetical protein
MFKMKKMLMFALVAGLLVGCQTVDESKEAVEQVEKQNTGNVKIVKVMERSTDVDEYMEYMNKYSQMFHQLNSDLHEHYVKAQEDPSIILTSIWKEELESYLKNAHGIYAVAKQRRLDMQVPKQFEEIHELNEGAYELTKLSIEKNLEALETGDKEAMEVSLFYQDMSNERVRQSTELIDEMLKNNQ